MEGAAVAAGVNIAHAVKEQKRGSDSGSDDQEPCKEEEVSLKAGIPKDQGGGNSKPSSSSPDEDLRGSKQEDELESAKAEMGEVMQENQRLKSHLDQIMKDYHALQLKFYEIVRQESKPPTTATITTTNNNAMPREKEEEAELVSLRLGRSPSLDSKNRSTTSAKGKEEGTIEDDGKEGSLLALGLDCRFEASKATTTAAATADQIAPLNSSTENRFDEAKDEAAGETWPPSKMLKNMRSGVDEVAQQAPAVKKARVSVRARCDTPTMNDGCQWRKYGQKIAKGNPCPRAYYRCTVAPSCPVRKQVQRCADDMSILITTYEGAHNHPLPVSATAMASTTSAAAYMLMSGSSTTSSLGSDLSAATTAAPLTTTSTTTAIGLHGMNSFNIPDDSRSKPFFLSSSSISPSLSHPTITLDLTASSSSSVISQVNRGTSSTSCFTPRYNSSTNLTFNSSEVNNLSLPVSWPNGLLSYNVPQAYNKNQVFSSSLSNIARHHPQDSNFYQSILQKGNYNISSVAPNYQQQIPETIAAAAKVLTLDPSFQSVLTAALSSFISGGSSSSGGASATGNSGGGNGGLNVVGGFGGGGGGGGGGGDGSGSFASKLKWCEAAAESSAAATSSLSSKGNGCASSFLSVATPSTKSQSAGSLMFLSSSLPFSTSKSSSASGDNRDLNK